MPTPKSNESKKEFIGRCIPFVLSEGKAKNQSHAYAMCNGIFEQSKKNLYSMGKKQ